MAPGPFNTYVDATFGGGTHTRALLESESTCKVIAIDWDLKAIELNAPSLKAEFGERFTMVWGNFAHLKYLLKKEKIATVDGILADFGTSQFQILNKPGFSFATNTSLDMRMSPAHQKVTAQVILNTASEKELATIFRDYGEEYAARSLARAIVARRLRKPFETTLELIDLVSCVKKHRNKESIHPATKVFQALRIVVNEELNNISAFLSQTIDLLAPNGKLVCISFHSLEDRIVKQFFKQKSGHLTILTPKIVTGSVSEISANPSCRSAKLRAAQKRI